MTMTMTIHEALDALRHREPFDENETMCGVSREALDVVMGYVGRGAGSGDDVERAAKAICSALGVAPEVNWSGTGEIKVPINRNQPAWKWFVTASKAALASLPAPTAEADGMEREEMRNSLVKLGEQLSCDHRMFLNSVARALASQSPQAPAAMPSEGE
jgi:hypothetical protein